MDNEGCSKSTQNASSVVPRRVPSFGVQIARIKRLSRRPRTPHSLQDSTACARICSTSTVKSDHFEFLKKELSFCCFRSLLPAALPRVWVGRRHTGGHSCATCSDSTRTHVARTEVCPALSLARLWDHLTTSIRNTVPPSPPHLPTPPPHPHAQPRALLTLPAPRPFTAAITFLTPAVTPTSAM